MKKIITLCLSLCMTAALAAPAYALEYSIAAPDDYDFGKDTSIEVIHTADGGAMKNADMSKNAALIPPAFGSESMNALHTGEYLTPNLAPGGIPASGAVIGGSAATVVTPGSATGVITPGSTVNGGSGYQPAVLFTEVTGDLYYKNGSLGRLEIHTLDIGDKIILTTKLGTRTYKVTDVFKVSETDRGGLADSGENMLTLYTCVRNQRDQRWCVTAAEV